MTFVLHTQHEEVVSQRARHEVKLQKLSLLPRRSSLSSIGTTSLSYEIHVGYFRLIRVVDIESNDLKESNEKGTAISIDSIVYSKLRVLLIFKFYMQRRHGSCKYSYSRFPKVPEGHKARLYIIKPPSIHHSHPHRFFLKKSRKTGLICFFLMFFFFY